MQIIAALLEFTVHFNLKSSIVLRFTRTFEKYTIFGKVLSPQIYVVFRYTESEKCFVYSVVKVPTKEEASLNLLLF